MHSNTVKSKSLRIIAMLGGLIVLCGLIAPATFGPAPVDASATQAAVIVAAGGTESGFASHTCLLKDGAVECVGSNDYGQLGNATTTSSSAPVKVVGLSSGVTAIELGEFHSCAIVSGQVKCWGLNNVGQLGNGETTDSSSPVAVTGLSGVTSLKVGSNHACATWTTSQASGVKCWGNNAEGQLGNGVDLDDPERLTFSSSPVAVSDLTFVSALALGKWHSCALVGGAVKCWGDNGDGYLGDGGTTNSSIPVDVVGLTDVMAIAAGAWHTCALDSPGGVKCWGWGEEGAVGDGTNTGQNTVPVQVAGLTSGVSAIDAGGYFSCAVLSSGLVKCWGYNAAGQLGDGSTDSQSTPVDVADRSGVTAIALGYNYACATTSDNVNCWGDNSYNQLVNGLSNWFLGPVILPSGINGTDNSDILVYACPAVLDTNDPPAVLTHGAVHFYAPAPTAVNGLSSLEPLQPGNFNWRVSTDNDSKDMYGAYSAQSSAIVLVEDSAVPLATGDEVTLTVNGRIDMGPVQYQASSFQMSTTVVNSGFSEGMGTIQNPYLIYNQSDLDKVRCYKNKHFALADDISLTGKWFPIGSDSSKWFGSLDGRGHSISNLEVGTPGMTRVGLFGAVESSTFKNLTFLSPAVTGSFRVGTLFGSGVRGTSVDNVTISDAIITGNSQVGILGGHRDYGGLVQKTSVSGVINAHPTVTRWEYGGPEKVTVDRPKQIGGIIGYDDGAGTAHINNQVDVEINVAPEVNFPQLAQQESLALAGSDGAYTIGGYVGETDDNISFKFLKVKSKINVAAFGGTRSYGEVPIERVGGVVGENESRFSEIDAETSINIVALSAMTIREIGGAIGYASKNTIDKSNLSPEIVIESGDGANNDLGLSHDGTGVIVQEVGGVGGQYNDQTSDAYVRAHAKITIRNVDQIRYVAGYLGYFQSNNGFGYSDNFVSGFIRLNAETSIQDVGGYTNLISSALLTGTRLFTAVEVSTSGSAAVARVGPFAGFVYEPHKQIAFNSFWDSTVNSAANPEGYPAQPATTAELKSKTFLSALGMDFQNVWEINSGSYPSLRPGVYTWGFSGPNFGSGGSVGNIGAPSPALSGPSKIVIPKSVKPGDRVIIKGELLDKVTQVFVAGKKVSFTIRESGNLTFKAPNLSPKKYLVKLVSDTAGTVFKKKIRILSR